MWCSDHHSDGGFRLLRSEGGQQSHPEHDVVQELGVGSEPSSAILQTQPLWLRMETGLLGYFIKHCHLSNKQTNTRSAPKPIQGLILCFCILSCQLFHFILLTQTHTILQTWYCLEKRFQSPRYLHWHRAQRHFPLQTTVAKILHDKQQTSDKLVRLLTLSLSVKQVDGIIIVGYNKHSRVSMVLQHGVKHINDDVAAVPGRRDVPERRKIVIIMY